MSYSKINDRDIEFRRRLYMDAICGGGAFPPMNMYDPVPTEYYFLFRLALFLKQEK